MIRAMNLRKESLINWEELKLVANDALFEKAF